MNSNIKAILNIGIIFYLRHEISTYYLDLMTSHKLGVTAFLVLLNVLVFSQRLWFYNVKVKLNTFFVTRITLFGETIFIDIGGSIHLKQATRWALGSNSASGMNLMSGSTTKSMERTLCVRVPAAKARNGADAGAGAAKNRGRKCSG